MLRLLEKFLKDMEIYNTEPVPTTMDGWSLELNPDYFSIIYEKMKENAYYYNSTIEDTEASVTLEFREYLDNRWQIINILVTTDEFKTVVEVKRKHYEFVNQFGEIVYSKSLEVANKLGWL
nr:MAG TPA: hypothetical protein [Caudoviricetes sp.]